MKKTLFKKLRSFTLVELIIVIAIVAILSVSAFLVVTKWIGKSRDSRRLSDLGSIKRALSVFKADPETYNKGYPMPDPDRDITVVMSGGAIGWYQGRFGDDTIEEIGNILSSELKDPTDNDYYRYSVTYDKKEYQIMVNLENVNTYNYLDSVFALETIATIDGIYDGYVITKTGSNTIIWRSPSLFLDIDDAVVSLENGGVLQLSGGMQLFQNDEGETIGVGSGVDSLDVSELINNPETTDSSALIDELKNWGISESEAGNLLNEASGSTVVEINSGGGEESEGSGLENCAFDSGITFGSYNVGICILQ